MTFILLWIFYHWLILNCVCQEKNNFRTKRNSEDIDNILQMIDESEEDTDSVNSEAYDDDISNKLKQERASDPHFIPLRISEDDFEDEDFYDEDIKMEKSLFPAMRQFPSMLGQGGPQPNPSMHSIPSQMPSNVGSPSGFLGRPQNNMFPSGMSTFPNSFTRPIPNSQALPQTGAFSPPPNRMVPFQGASPGLNMMPAPGISSPMHLQTPNSFPNSINSNPNSMSPFNSGSPNIFGNNPNSKFNPSANQPFLSPQRSSPLTMPLTGSQPFPQQNANPFSPQTANPFPSQPINPFSSQPANRFTQTLPNNLPQQSANHLPQQPTKQFTHQPVNPFFLNNANPIPQKPNGNLFPQQPVMSLPHQTPPMPFPQQQPAFAIPQKQPIGALPQTQPPQPTIANPSGKPSSPFMTNGFNPLSSLFPYFILPFPFGK